MIAEILCGNASYDEKALNDSENYLYAHRDMIKELLADGLCKDMATAEQKVIDRVNQVCKNILFNTAVFKPNKQGKDGFVRFLNSNGVK